MCLLFFSYKLTPGYRLVVAANRDEFLARPTARLDFLDREKTLLAGRDLQGGGTWLGITAGQRFAAITNYREPATNRPDAPSRGEILMNYLAGSMGAGEYMQALAARASVYNGFNLILGDSCDLYYYSNKISAPRLLGPGFYGLSNHLLDTPWPKVQRGKELLRPHMVETDHVDPLSLLSLLADSRHPPDDKLPETGVGFAWERLLGTIFIDGPNYGTRSSAVITLSDAGAIEFTEKTVRRDATQDNEPELVRLNLNG
ncbi:MAG: NRDE family protein [Proteobacteria bacterium]|nr:NRDE family protein [Pseudomonadota bacterium]